MLKVTWNAKMVGAPYRDPDTENRAYFEREDFLTLNDGAAPRQPMPRSDSAFVPVDPAFDSAVSQWLGDKKRVVVMVHGFSYSPVGTTRDAMGSDPAETVYGIPDKVGLNNSWLPLVGEYDADGSGPIADLAIGFSWNSDPSFSQYGVAGWSNPYQLAVWDQAALAAKGLAFLLSYLVRKGVAVTILAHSLGTRVTSSAMGMLDPGGQDATIDKVVLLDGAEYCVDAWRAFSGRSCQIFNIAHRGDTVLSLGARQMCHPVRYNGTDAARVIGFDGVRIADNWLDIQLDGPAAGKWLAAQNYPVTPDPDPDDVHANAGLRHWVCYTNTKNRKLVAALVQKPDMTIAWFMTRTAEPFPAGLDWDGYGKFDEFVSATPPDERTRKATDGWDFKKYEIYNGL